MRAQVQKWGNSLAIRIPKAYADELNWQHNTPIETRLEDGRLVIETAAGPAFSLDELLKDITQEMLHGEFDFGPRAGREVW